MWPHACSTSYASLHIDDDTCSSNKINEFVRRQWNMPYAKPNHSLLIFQTFFFLFSGKRNDKTLYTEILCILLPILNKNPKSDF